MGRFFRRTELATRSAESRGPFKQIVRAIPSDAGSNRQPQALLQLRLNLARPSRKGQEVVALQVVMHRRDIGRAHHERLRSDAPQLIFRPAHRVKPICVGEVDAGDVRIFEVNVPDPRR